MSKYSRNVDLAMACAEDYRTFVSRGDVVLAEQSRRSIEELVGSYRAGQLVLPRPVCEAMGRMDLCEARYAASARRP